MGTPILWLAFNVCVLALLALDLGVFHRGARAISLRTAAAWSAFWIALSLGFNLWIWRAHGAQPAIEFLTGYVLEKSMSLDNLLVFVLVFRTFGVEARYQYRVLFWGVIGALVMRGLLIGIGAALVARFDWILVGVGVLLAAAGARMLFRGHPEVTAEHNWAVRWAKRIFLVAEGDPQGKFWLRQNGRFAATTLFLTLIVVEAADWLFALDSVPAVFGVTRDPFLVYTSNVCAILGLRALYFLLAGALPLFRYLDAGVSVVLIFIGGKMVVEPWLQVPTGISLAVIGVIFSIAAVASLLRPRPSETPVA